MLAGDLMTRDVVTVSPETPVKEVARLLLQHGISAAPVVDASGTVIGMVSEGDLIGREDADREARRDWWLALLAEGADLHPDFLKTIREPVRTARDVMVAPVIGATETTDAAEIARMLKEYRIKRVPIVRDGRVIGIVSRADLLRAVASDRAEAHHQDRHHGLVSEFLSSLGTPLSLHGSAPSPTAPSAGVARSAGEEVSAAAFRDLEFGFQREKAERQTESARAAEAQRRDRIKTLIDVHFSDQGWRALIHRAKEAAEHGEKEFMLLRFPSGLCIDGGRAINSFLPDWPKALRGEAAEIYLRWERDLKPRGFGLVARILDFPGGMPGDVGMFLTWGQ